MPTHGVLSLGNSVFNLLLGTLFEWGVALHGVELTKVRKGKKSMDEVRKDLRVIGKKVAKQVGKDYIIFPALSGPGVEAHPGRERGSEPHPQLLGVSGDLLRALP